MGPLVQRDPGQRVRGEKARERNETGIVTREKGGQEEREKRMEGEEKEGELSSF